MESFSFSSLEIDLRKVTTITRDSTDTLIKVWMVTEEILASYTKQVDLLTVWYPIYITAKIQILLTSEKKSFLATGSDVRTLLTWSFVLVFKSEAKFYSKHHNNLE